MWLTNEISVAEANFASETTRMLTAQLLPHAKLRPSNGRTMLAASVAGNEHDIGLQTVVDFFEMDGWRTIPLSANVPAREVAQAVDCFAVDLLGLSVSQTIQLEAVTETIEAVRRSARGTKVKILLGGRALANLDGLPKELGADGYAADPIAAVVLGRQLAGLG